MKRTTLVVFSMIALCNAMARSPSAASSLSAALAPYKFRHVELSQQGANLALRGSINGKSATLVLSTAAPLSVLDRRSLRKFGIAERKTEISVSSAFGKTGEHVGFGKVSSFEFAGIVLADFEAGTLDESVLNRTAPSASSHIDGVFALSQMRTLGAVIDCARRDMYVNPWGPRADASGQLAKILLTS